MSRTLTAVSLKQRKQPAIVVGSAGALAAGAVAIGAIAIGALAIGFLAVRTAKFGKMEIDELTIRRIRILESLPKNTTR